MSLDKDHGFAIAEVRFGSDRWVRLPDTSIEVRVCTGPERAFRELRRACRRSAGRLLAEHRLAWGMTQAELADRLCRYQPTVTRHEVSRWERGERLPYGMWLDRVAAELHLSEQSRRTIDWNHTRLPDAARQQVSLAVNRAIDETFSLDLHHRRWTAVPGCAWRVRPVSRRLAVARAGGPS